MPVTTSKTTTQAALAKSGPLGSGSVSVTPGSGNSGSSGSRPSSANALSRGPGSSGQKTQTKTQQANKPASNASAAKPVPKPTPKPPVKPSTGSSSSAAKPTATAESSNKLRSSVQNVLKSPYASAAASEEATRRQWVNSQIGPLFKDPSINRALPNAIGVGMWNQRIADSIRIAQGKKPIGAFGERTLAPWKDAGLRTRQEALQNKKSGGGIRKSYHNFGLAADIVTPGMPKYDAPGYKAWENRFAIANKDLAAQIPASLGIKWGGTFKRSDPAHFQLGSGGRGKAINKYGTPVVKEGIRPNGVPGPTAMYGNGPNPFSPGAGVFPGAVSPPPNVATNSPTIPRPNPRPPMQTVQGNGVVLPGFVSPVSPPPKRYVDRIAPEAPQLPVPAVTAGITPGPISPYSPPAKQITDRLPQDPNPAPSGPWPKLITDRVPQGTVMAGPMPPSMPRGTVMAGPMPPSMGRGTVMAGPMPPSMPKGTVMAGPMPPSMSRGAVMAGPMPPSMPKGTVMAGPMPPTMPRGTVMAGPMPPSMPMGSVMPGPMPPQMVRPDPQVASNDTPLEQGDTGTTPGLPFRNYASPQVPKEYADRYLNKPAEQVVTSENPVQGSTNPSQEPEDPRTVKERQQRQANIGATVGGVVAGPVGSLLGYFLGSQMGKTSPNLRHQIAQNPRAITQNVDSINKMVNQHLPEAQSNAGMRVTEAGFRDVMAQPEKVMAEPEKYTTLEQMLAALALGIDPSTGKPV